MRRNGFHLVLFIFMAAVPIHSQEGLQHNERMPVQTNPGSGSRMGNHLYDLQQNTTKLSDRAEKALVGKGFEIIDPFQTRIVTGNDSLKKENDCIQVPVRFDLGASGMKSISRGIPANGVFSQTAVDTILTDGFEGDFPGTTWQRSGDPTWGKAINFGHSGSYGVWPAKDGSDGREPWDGYPANSHAVMVYGPFDLSDANTAFLDYYFMIDTEYEKDWFFCMASLDGEIFNGMGFSGYAEYWKERLDLTAIPDLGDLTGHSQVWIAFIFESDEEQTNDQGVFLDDITLIKESIAGTIIKNAVSGEWDPGHNPYIVVSDVIIQDFDSLRIKPGVEIYFHGNYSFDIDGFLYAEGDETDPILFSSNKPDPKPGDWGGLHFSLTEGECRLSHCTIEYARYAVGCYNSDPILSSNTIRYNSDCGIEIRDGSPLIEHNLIEYNQFGISALLSGPQINSNIIRNNSDCGIRNLSSSSVLKNNEIYSNGSHGVYCGGLEVLTAFAYQIMKNRIVENNGSGLCFGGTATYLYLTQNTILRNSHHGIEVSYTLLGPCAYIYNNTICENGISGILFMDENLEQSVVKNNILYKNNQYGISAVDPHLLIEYNDVCQNTSDLPQFHADSLGIKATTNANGDSSDYYFNIFDEPLFVSYENDDFVLHENSPCKNAGDPHFLFNDEDGTPNDIGAYGGSLLFSRIYDDYSFDQTPAGLSKDMTITLHNSRNSTFAILNLRLSDNINFSILKNEMTIQPYSSDFIAITFHPQSSGSFDATLTLRSDDFFGADSFIVNLHGDGTGGTVINDWRLSGVLTKSQSPYTITTEVVVPRGDSLIIEPGVHIIFEGEKSMWEGWPGIKVEGLLTAKGTINDSITFTADREDYFWSGIRFIKADDKSVLRYCIIENTRGEDSDEPRNAHGVYIEDSSVEIGNSLFLNNHSYWTGAGIYIYRGTPVIKNNIFMDNWTYVSGVNSGAVITVVNSDAQILNNLIVGNTGGIYCALNASPFILNNTICNNSGGSIGAVFCKDGSSPRILNSIIWNNSPQAITLKDSSGIDISYSNIAGNHEGESNFSEDPDFVDTSRSDYHLDGNSPCIDMGCPDFQYNDPEDPGNPGHASYPALGTIRNDAGVYGGPGSFAWVFDTDVDDQDDFQSDFPLSLLLYQNYPNPFNPSTTICFSVAKSSPVILKMFDMLGREVSTLVDDVLAPGEHSAVFQGKDLPAGVYFCRLEAEGRSQARKLVLVK